MECLSFCIANKTDLTALDNYYKKNQPTYDSTKSRDQLKLTAFDNKQNLIYIFKNGTVVSWGVKRHQIKAHLDIIRPFTDKPISLHVHDEFSYQRDDITAIKPHDYFDVDCLRIDSDNEELKLSLSYGFSQSVKLQYFETILETLIEKYTPFIHRLANKGGIGISRRQILHVIGDILAAQSEMNLVSNFLSHPKYFWRHPTLEVNFIMLERYLHVQRRANAINHRLDTLNEIFDMLNGFLENRHSHNLEIIIIFLIAIEITFNALHFHF
jgi:uncharacterized Rmd1/YagE family protein